MERNSSLGNREKIALSGIGSLPAERELYYSTKRIIDIIVSVCVLMIFSPLMLVIAILIRFDSAGPIIFTQKRIGSKKVKRAGQYYWEKTEFPCYKFRTMVDKADPELHQTFVNALINHDDQKIAAIQGGESKVKKIVNDPRVTRLGLFLRVSSLDELPQFWNVLRNEMSVIGPRPAIPYEVEMYKPWYFRRLETKPGITGLWQVSARNSCDFDGMVKLDIKYVEEQSCWLDLKIMFMTPLVMLRRKSVA
ncbi:MAG TPA: sugar transferase [Leptolinea sp.]